ncbi:MFS transporter [Maricaulis sp. MIT060901]|uniref:MFS transporter n=1 Tax=Maricaulis sp. MIT060901 TaxID=3096993 RepID=UPI00399B27E5
MANPADTDSGKWLSITLIVLAQILALSVWFSGTAALPAILEVYTLGAGKQAALTSSVQAGFVLAALFSAVFSLPDRFNPRHLFAGGALIAAASNLLALQLAPDSWWLVFSRFTAGAALALVYPVGMKLAASWAKGDAGLLVGLLVGALTLGSASPFLLSISGASSDWQTPIRLAAIGAGLAAVTILFARGGPGLRPAARFDPGAILLAVRNPALRLANLGYLGHMWELYAMWAWIGAFSHAYWNARGASANLADLTAFAVIGSGALACVVAGGLADQFGRTRVTSVAMAISGSCALLAGLAFNAPPWVLMPILIIWGLSIIADSAQFSTAITELAPPDRAGTLLTVQTALGFTLTILMVQILPSWIAFAGWSWAFAPLAIGPFLGVWAMLSLRRLPEAKKMASGKR